MHPWDHARSSAAALGGRPEDHVGLHSWFDATKAVRAHFTHRALRHHAEGVSEAIAVHGATMAGASTMGMGRMHLMEDTGREPTAADWLEGADAMGLPRSTPTTGELAARGARRLGGTAAEHLPLHEWFMATTSWIGDERHLIMRHHSLGIFEAEARFGVVLRTSAGPVPTRIAAEGHVRAVMGTVPSAGTMIGRIAPARWMANATSPTRLGLR